MLKPGATVELIMVACAICLKGGCYELDTMEDYLEEKHIRLCHPEMIMPDDVGEEKSITGKVTEEEKVRLGYR